MSIAWRPSSASPASCTTTRAASSSRRRATPAAIDALLARLPAEAPPMAVVDAVTPEVVPARNDAGFVIASSAPGAADALVSPDAATCEACLRELFDPADRRYRYPFINCTDCGPRFTIVRGVPYDRPLTTMAGFTMCALCEAEYHDPTDRRFHAQPNACPTCGPNLEGSDPLGSAVDALRDGADRRGQGDRRVSSRVRGLGRGRGGDAAGAQAPRGEAVRADGSRSRGGRAAGRARPGRDRPAARPRPPDRARPAAARRPRGRRGRARDRPSSG